MRRTAVAFFMGGLGALWLGGATLGGAGDVAGDIQATADRLLADASPAPGDTLAALGHLVETAAGVGREAHLPAAVQAKLDAASEQARTLSPLDARVRAAVDEAYAALNAGRAFEFPKSVGSIEQAKAYGRSQIGRCLAALSAGRAEEAARELLGLVRLVITPMEAKQ
jgi:hypothetical protein